MLLDEYSRPLKKPEARHRYWHIQKADRDFFPESGVVFKLMLDNKTYELKVNHKDDIMTGQLYEKYRFLEGDRIIVTKKKNNSYVLQAPDSNPYPELD
ncbi:hypothetical protein [Candidatus Nitrosopumilus sediminis]|uniref:Uncharacterized protein n=1 Tax=Candidatus Nitrosopumilus sediminis TaxID=1229909 RepID=K0BD73_9ARCH|nr:hypothetical protein [Candidatus Nitrosopumilus sediminis]AFS83379.1 hypothetical protein NSED_07935 [Candidatus Nitrosopumilus sediminis]